ncbi:hypothetical protein ACU4HD_44125 [Cupriavidus basilensis]
MLTVADRLVATPLSHARALAGRQDGRRTQTARRQQGRRGAALMIEPPFKGCTVLFCR